jgi:ATP-binding cassette subfamily C (CFTR/MRP) protein 1
MLNITSGSIIVDDIDLADVPREAIRSRFTAIPQEPYFLEGSIRLNLDLSATVSDSNILAALEKVQLRNLIETHGGLDAMMQNDILSHGQKQLFCLARAMLKRSKIVAIDEATSR